MAYKHRDIVIAWMDGETIQEKVRNGWRDLHPFDDGFHFLPEGDEYRIKPKSVMIRHYKTAAGTCGVLMEGFSKFEDEYTENYEYDPTIIFLDDWHEASFGPKED